MKVKAVCEACKGTGLYQGMAEKDGCVVVCARCKGTGCVELEYEPFTFRKHRGGVKRVFKGSFGYFHFAEDNRLANGDVVRYSQGGCTYEEWLNGEEQKPVKDLYCPYQWTGQMLQCEDVNDLYKTRCSVECLLGRNISDCRYFPDKAECWRIYEGDAPNAEPDSSCSNCEHSASEIPTTFEARLTVIEEKFDRLYAEIRQIRDSKEGKAMNQYMKLAIEAAREGMNANRGGPFGAVIVRNDEPIAVACNEVLATYDPTAHAEIVAIRKATSLLRRFDLSDCEMYATCEPCPMCLSAIHFAGIKKLYYGANRHHARTGGFDDIRIYQLIDGVANSDIRRISKLPLLHPTVIEQDGCATLFDEWNAKADRTMY